MINHKPLLVSDGRSLLSCCTVLHLVCDSSLYPTWSCPIYLLFQILFRVFISLGKENKESTKVSLNTANHKENLNFKEFLRFQYSSVLYN